jgi:hypothetical protein
MRRRNILILFSLVVWFRAWLFFGFVTFVILFVMTFGEHIERSQGADHDDVGRKLAPFKETANKSYFVSAGVNQIVREFVISEVKDWPG